MIYISLKSVPEAGCRGEALCGIRAARSEDNGGQILVCVDGRRERFSAQPPHIGFVHHGNREISRRGIVGIAQGREIAVQEDVQGDAQGIQVGRTVIFIAVIDLGRHVLDRPRAAHGHFLVDGIHGPGDAEIAQFVSALLAVKNIAEFDISVDDIFLFTADQGVADIQSQLQGLGAAETTPAVFDLFYTFQLLHANQDGPRSLSPNYGVILDRDDVGVALELHHHVDFMAHTADEFFKIFIRFIRDHLEDLHGTGIVFAQIIPD